MKEQEVHMKKEQEVLVKKEEEVQVKESSEEPTLSYVPPKH